jgi:hypothetical protein
MADRRRIGIDLDNTLINYDAVFCAFAKERGLLDSAAATSKAAIREALRAMPEGDLVWQRLQGAVYGKGVRRAVLFDGAAGFLQRAREQGCEIFIVSHKTEFGHFDPDRVNLRDAALGWMKSQGFFRDEGFGIPNGNVLFTATRSDKIAAIAELEVEIFIDDLPEVLEDKGFPSTVTGILFTAGGAAPSAYPRAFAHWRNITRTVFG